MLNINAISVNTILLGVAVLISNVGARHVIADLEHIQLLSHGHMCYLYVFCMAYITTRDALVALQITFLYATIRKLHPKPISSDDDTVDTVKIAKTVNTARATDMVNNASAVNNAETVVAETVVNGLSQTKPTLADAEIIGLKPETPWTDISNDEQEYILL